ncbi:Mak16 protein [Linderina pennispora]|uniref:Protein MAK16 n=1 Tax=Linderina pennispora TaxID=61395 RepID=A0A1Y1WD42_9FUNG|nr:Mak16 protein [Linderina pennispora]ORX71440.1 Mak16 protein [Linderina pennispora]
MNNDGLIWEVLNNQFCSYKVKTNVGSLCRHPYNLTGLCNKRDCPLANSKYATVRERDGRIYLCMKTPERAHTPAKLWEMIALPKNFADAIEIIDKELLYWPDWMVNMCKQRLTRITQYLIRTRKLKLKNKHTLVPIKKKLERREKSREVRAEQAARLDQSIEKELLERLKNKAYGDQPLNVNENVWREILEADEVEAESDVTTEDELEDEEEIEEEEENVREFVSDNSDFEDDMEDMLGMDAGRFSSASEDDSEEEDSDVDSVDSVDSEDEEDEDNTPKKSAKAKRPAPTKQAKPAKKPKKRGPRVEVEYETEAQDDMLTNW